MPRQTIFYSWQSDTPIIQYKDVSKEFIFKALTVALTQARSEYPELAEFELDRDSRGVAGSPGLIDTILKKISESCLFLADVTFIGKTEGDNSKLIPNPNVMFELGHASTQLGLDRIILVMNTHFGDADELPFDIRHRRFPIRFCLEPGAPDSIRKSEREKLINALKEALFVACKNGLLNRYANEAQVRAALWILRCVQGNANFLFETLAHQYGIYPFSVIDIEKVDAIVERVSMENIRSLNSISTVGNEAYLPYLSRRLEIFTDEIKNLLGRYTVLGGNLIFTVEDVLSLAIALHQQLMLSNSVSTSSIPQFDSTLRACVRKLLVAMRLCLIEARNIRNEPIT